MQAILYVDYKLIIQYSYILRIQKYIDTIQSFRKIKDIALYFPPHY